MWSGTGFIELLGCGKHRCPPLELIAFFVRVGIALVLPLLNNNSRLASTLVLNLTLYYLYHQISKGGFLQPVLICTGIVFDYAGSC